MHRLIVLQLCALKLGLAKLHTQVARIIYSVVAGIIGDLAAFKQNAGLALASAMASGVIRMDMLPFALSSWLSHLDCQLASSVACEQNNIYMRREWHCALHSLNSVCAVSIHTSCVCATRATRRLLCLRFHST